MYMVSVLVMMMDVVIVMVYCELGVCRYGLSVTMDTTVKDVLLSRAVEQQVIVLTMLPL